MTMGRPPKPTRLRLLEGNPGRRPINENEPRPRRRQRIPSPPDDLGEIGKAEWRKMGPVLVRLGLLTEMDTTAFHMYCATYERWVDAERQARENPIIQTPSGYFQHSPYTSLANRLYYMVKQSLSDFGMTPSSRSRVAVDPSDRQDDELSEFLYRTRAK
jgi:P27 family predicted phage terminase small subunit